MTINSKKMRYHGVQIPPGYPQTWDSVAVAAARRGAHVNSIQVTEKQHIRYLPHLYNVN